MAVISPSSIRQGVFAALRTLIIAHKPTYTYNSGTITYSVVAAFPRDNPTFPIVVLNTASIKLIPINIDGSGERYEVEVRLDFYAKEIHGKLAIDTSQGELCATFLANRALFDTNNGLLFAEDFWEDSKPDSFSNGIETLNTGSSLVRFVLK